MLLPDCNRFSLVFFSRLKKTSVERHTDPESDFLVLPRHPFLSARISCASMWEGMPHKTVIQTNMMHNLPASLSSYLA